MLYHPNQLYVWDTWCYVWRNEMHCIHLQLPRKGCERPAREYGALAHAVSPDLVHWREAGMALYPGEPGSYDDRELWTGCVVEDQGTLYMYYTARSSRENGQVNRIGLATSTDGYTWVRHPENPILTPDDRWYAGEKHQIELYGHGHPIMDCRDMCVVKDPNGDGWWGFFAARRHADTNADSSVIGLAHSKDLVHWEQYPPCFMPKYLGCVEVPDVFSLDGKWYMICLTGNCYGHRGCVSDPLLTRATVYAVSDNICGPYVMMEDDNVLLGSVVQQGYSAKTVLWNGVRTLFYTQSEGVQFPHGSLSRPQQVRADAKGHLRLCWHPACDSLYIPETPGKFMDPRDGRWGSLGAWRMEDNGVQGGCDGDWAVLPWEKPFEDGYIACEIELQTARSAGICLRMPGEDIMSGGVAVLLDAKQNQLVLTKIREFPNLEARTFPIERNRRYRLKVVVTGYVFNVYIDDVLWIQCYEPCARTGHAALFVEHGTAFFANLNLQKEL